MKTFKSISDLEQLKNNPLYTTVEPLVMPIIAKYPDYRPEEDGYLVLIEHADMDRVLDDLDMHYRLSEVPFEGVTVGDGCFHAVYLANNQFALDFLIPDAEWLPGDVRRVLVEHLDP